MIAASIVISKSILVENIGLDFIAIIARIIGAMIVSRMTMHVSAPIHIASIVIRNLIAEIAVNIVMYSDAVNAQNGRITMHIRGKLGN